MMRGVLSQLAASFYVGNAVKSTSPSDVDQSESSTEDGEDWDISNTLQAQETTNNQASLSSEILSGTALRSMGVHSRGSSSTSAEEAALSSEVLSGTEMGSAGVNRLGTGYTDWISSMSSTSAEEDASDDETMQPARSKWEASSTSSSSLQSVTNRCGGQDGRSRFAPSWKREVSTTESNDVDFDLDENDHHSQTSSSDASHKDVRAFMRTSGPNQEESSHSHARSSVQVRCTWREELRLKIQDLHTRSNNKSFACRGAQESYVLPRLAILLWEARRNCTSVSWKDFFTACRSLGVLLHNAKIKGLARLRAHLARFPNDATSVSALVDPEMWIVKRAFATHVTHVPASRGPKSSRQW